MPWKYNNKIIRVGKAWSDNNGTQHPYNWVIWNDKEKVSRGLLWEDDPILLESNKNGNDKFN